MKELRELITNRTLFVASTRALNSQYIHVFSTKSLTNINYILHINE